MQTLNAPINKDAHAASSSGNDVITALAQSSFLHTALGGLDLRLDEELERYRHWQDNGMSYLKPFQSQSQRENNYSTYTNLGNGLGQGNDSFINASAYPPAKPKLPRQNIDLPKPTPKAASATVAPKFEVASEAVLKPKSQLDNSLLGNSADNFSPSPVVPQPRPMESASSNGNRTAVETPQPLHTRLELPLESLDTNYGDKPTYSIGLGDLGIAGMPQAFTVPPKVENPSTAAPENQLRDAAAVNQPVTEEQFLQNLSEIYPEAPNFTEEEPLPPPPPHPAVVVVASLLNPVGLISLLLLLVSSATIGYLLVDPSGVIRIFNPNYGKAAPAVKANPAEEPAENNGTKSNNRQRTETTTIPFVPSTGSAGALTTPNGLPATVPANSTTKTNPANGTNTANGPNPNRTPGNTPNFTRATPLAPVANDAPRNNAVTPLALPPVVNETPVETPRPASRPAPRVVPTAPVASRPARNTPAASSAVNSSTATVAASASSNSGSSNSGSSNNGVRYGAPLTSLPMATESAPTKPSSYRVSVDSEYAQQAQKVQPDAFTRSSDGQTQLGSYSNPNAAAQRVEELRRQGIPAKVE